MNNNGKKIIHQTLCLFLVYISMGWAMCSLSARADITLDIPLRSTVHLAHDTVYFRDIIEPDFFCDMRTREIQDLFKITLCKAPQPGRQRQLSRSFIVMKLKNNNADVSGFNLSGAKDVDIIRKSTVITVAALQEEIATYLQQKYNIIPNESKLLLENVRDNIVLPAGTYHVRIEEMQAGVRRGHMNLRISFVYDDTVEKKKVVNIKVLVKCNPMIAAQTINANDEITAAAVTQDERYVPYGAPVYTLPADVIGKIAKIRIVAGDVIMEKHVKEKPAVQQGDVVAAMVMQKNMAICMKLKAMEAGACGDVIKLYSPSTKKHFVGKIKSSEEVEVMF